ncbi:winged helix-turn-helix domain-containing protein [Roseiarcus fermentans]|uniref:winged helix-turn-helix domain-containing protein n=1 Tax=Roseiarcus fermentans TaxID=1473586 RepID=UPI000DEA3B2E|nr:winged helix-turn-helix domain-containing protein [Roseiarcus fermentans]
MGARVPGRCTTVLVLTGEPALVRLARSILEPDRIVSGSAPFGPESLAVAGAADIVVIDLEAVDQDAILAVRRAYFDAALIVLSPERGETACIAALEMGADYLPRPFSPTDLAVRVRVAELRRFAATGRPRFYHNGALAFDLFSGKLSIDGQTVALAPSELAVLAHLAGKAGGVVGYERLLGDAESAGSPRGRAALRSCVMHLRHKIERDPLHPEILLAEIGVGYRLAPPTAGPMRRPRDCLPKDPE